MIFQNDALIVGLTGMSGAGKTTACEVFRECGYAVADCDRLARRVTEKGKPALREIVRRFGAEYLDSDGALNRRALGKRIFSSEADRLALDELIYPYISYEMISLVISYIDRGFRLILLDAPTLFESGTDTLCDRIVAVVSDREKCIGRIVARDALPLVQARDRLSAQFSAEYYRSRSDFCVENNGTEEELRERVRDLAARIGEGRDRL